MVTSVSAKKYHLKTNLWKKAYLIEFLGVDGVTVEEAFTFSLPPESEDFAYSQRKTETKTFGGLHVDNYGADAVKISLAGSTVNQALKKIYRPGKLDKWMSGEDEIFYLRDLLLKYSTGKENLQKKVMLYDLSKIDRVGGSNTTNRATKNYWQVFLGDFKIRRASDRPFTYRYSIELTGVDPKGPKKGKYPKWFGIDFEEMINNIDNAMEKLNKALSWMEDVANAIADARAFVQGAKDALSAFTDGINGFVNNAADMTNSITAEAFGLYDDVTMGFVTYGLETGLAFQNSTLALTKAVSNVATQCRRIGSEENYKIPEDILEQYDCNAQEFQDTINCIAGQAQEDSETVAAGGKSGVPDITIGSGDKQQDKNPVVNANGRYLCSRVSTVYGSTPVTVTSGTTLESVATKYLGSADRAADIATYNGIASMDDLSPGDTIFVPVFEQTDAIQNNLVYALKEDMDNYGKDIAIDDAGNIKISQTGDFLLTDGSQNLSQAILLRLRENVDSRIRLSMYGIKNTVADPVAGVSYLLSSIEMTVSADPRVKGIEDIRFSGSGDNLYVEIDYTDINENVSTAKGSV
jgi:hypothetical protein